MFLRLERLAEINRAFMIPTIIYIDDTILVAPQEIMEEVEATVDLYYELCGFTMSAKKNERLEEGESMKVLGVEFMCDGEGILAKIPDKKRRELRDLFGELESEVKGEAKGYRRREEETAAKTGGSFGEYVSQNLVERIHGKGIFCCSLEQSVGAPYFRALAQAAADETLRKRSDKKSMARLVRLIEGARKTEAGLKPIPIKRGLFLGETVKFVSDATGDGFLGGLTETEDGKALGWKMRWGKGVGGSDWKFWKKGGRKEDHVGIYEALAVLVNLVRFKKEARGKKIYFFVDNLGVVYNMCKLSSKCPICQSIAILTVEFCRLIEARPYFIYISTEVNPADGLTREEKLYLTFNDFPNLKIVPVKKKLTRRLTKRIIRHRQEGWSLNKNKNDWSINHGSFLDVAEEIEEGAERKRETEEGSEGRSKNVKESYDQEQKVQTLHQNLPESGVSEGDKADEDHPPIGLRPVCERQTREFNGRSVGSEENIPRDNLAEICVIPRQGRPLSSPIGGRLLWHRQDVLGRSRRSAAGCVDGGVREKDFQIDSPNVWETRAEEGEASAEKQGETAEQPGASAFIGVGPNRTERRLD